MNKISLIFFSILLSACTGLPHTVQPVTNFNLEKYLGTWYEIARLDHSFERGLNNISATYSMRDDGGVKVLNRGFSIDKNEWSQAEGRGYFMGADNIGHLKVSFFGPFYGSYAIFELDNNYEYAFISGNNYDYLWLLARTPVVDDVVIETFKEKAKNLGFNTSELIFVEHNKN